MCCELHTKISECEELETQLRVKLGLVRSRRKHFQETLQMLEEPVSASYAALDAVYDVDHTLDPKRSLLAWTQTLDSGRRTAQNQSVSHPIFERCIAVGSKKRS